MIEGTLCLALMSAPVCAAPGPVNPPVYAAVERAAASYPACLGKTVPMRVSREMPYSEAEISGRRGMFLLDYGANVSSIDLNALPGLKPIEGSCDPSAPGRQCAFDDFFFISGLGRANLLTADYSGLLLDFRQAGIIGTDFLSENAFTLRFSEGALSSSGKSGFCTPDALGAAGFIPLSAAGYFSYDVSTLLPLSALNAGYYGPLSVPNIPAVPVRLAGVEVVAQIDTGYSDYISRHSININPALYTRIAAAAPGALQRWPENDKKLSTCVPGVLEPAEAYRLNRGAIELIAEDGRTARTFKSAVIYVKHTPKEAMSCGGIGTHTSPSAQLGASFIADMGAVIFDPFGSRVWIPGENPALIGKN